MKRLFVSVWVLLMATAFLRAAPSTQPSPDLSSPRSALLTIYSAMRAGDIQAVKSCLIFEDAAAADVFDASVAQVCAPLQLMHAMEARFGESGKKPFDASIVKSIDAAIDHVNRAEIAVTGETAIVAEKKAAVNPDAETELSGVTLKKLANQWKIVASTFPESGGDVSTKQLALMRSLRDAVVAACQTTIARLQRGDFSSPDEAYAAYQSLLQPSASAAAKTASPAPAAPTQNK